MNASHQAGKYCLNSHTFSHCLVVLGSACYAYTNHNAQTVPPPQTYLFYMVHWIGCLMYYAARIYNFSDESWVRDGDPGPVSPVSLCSLEQLSVLTSHQYCLGQISVPPDHPRQNVSTP